MDFLSVLKNAILPQNTVIGQSKGKNKATLLIDEMVFAFEESIEQKSTPRSLIFNTAYVAYIPQNYYRDLHLSFGIISREIADIFEEKLEEYLDKHKNIRLGTLVDSWSFDIIPLAENGVVEGENPDEIVRYEELEDKFVVVRSSLVPEELYNFSGEDENSELRTNRSKPSSTNSKLQKLTLGAIIGLKSSGRGYNYPIRIQNAKGDVSSKKDTMENVKANIKCADDTVSFLDPEGNKYRSMDIRLDHFFIGGPSASTMYHGVPIVRLDSEEVLSPHLEFRQEADGTFSILPYGTIELSLIPLQKNCWQRLPNRNASIMLNGNIELIFNHK